MVLIRRIVFDALLWLCLFAGLALPILFNIGYEPHNLEVILISAALAIVAIGASQLPRWLAGVVTGLVLALTVHVHYLPKELTVVLYAILPVSLLISMIWPRTIFVAAATSGLATASFTAVTIGGFWIDGGLAPKVAPSIPAVIHLVMDEYAAPAGLPSNILSAAVVKEEANWFVRRGFTVFERSYSTQRTTHSSLALLANADRADVDPSTHLKRYDNSRSSGVTWSLTSASAFAAIAKRRAMRSVTTTYFDVGQVLANITSGNAASTTYNNRVPYPVISSFPMSVLDRFTMMRGLVHGWLKGRQDVALYQMWVEHTASGKWFDSVNAIAWRFTPLTSILAMDRLSQIYLPNLRAGEYLFAHLLLPHFPYVFTKECSLRPASAWRNKTVVPGQRNTLETRAERYRLYAEQIACTRTGIDRLLTAIDDNPALKDAVVIVHGDHGSRIAIEDHKSLAEKGYQEDEYLRDWHSALFAVRLPDRRGSIISEPYAIHDLFWTLIANDFTSLELANVPVRPLAARLYPPDQ